MKLQAMFKGRLLYPAAILIGLWATLSSDVARAATTVFFSSSQTTNHIASGPTSDTLSCEGYLFTYTRDNLFTGGVGLTNPIGRAVRIPWPDGLEAQAVTAGPVLSGARIDIKRQDGRPFDILSFTAELLANTAGAGADFEIMPMLNGEDGLPDPVLYGATGYYGQQFTYNTPQLTGFDAYKMTLYVDYAVTSLTVVDAGISDPVLAISKLDGGLIELSWPTNAVRYTLESTTNIPATVWNPVTNHVAVNGSLFTVQLVATESRQLYRLRQ